MSKYTTQVRFICETAAGLTESAGSGSVDEIIEKSWNKIFTTKCEFFDENYRQVLCSKILKHYYMREIGAETIGLWKLWVNTRLEEIMPYYNAIYKAVQTNFDPFDDVKLSRVKDGNESNIGTTNTSVKNNSTGYDLTSDTPQGGLDGLDSMKYLSEATKNTNDSHGKTETGFNSNLSTGETEQVTGKQGTQSFSSMLHEYEEYYINVDLKVIGEFEDLFMLLW